MRGDPAEGKSYKYNWFGLLSPSFSQKTNCSIDLITSKLLIYFSMPSNIFQYLRTAVHTEYQFSYFRIERNSHLFLLHLFFVLSFFLFNTCTQYTDYREKRRNIKGRYKLCPLLNRLHEIFFFFDKKM